MKISEEIQYRIISLIEGRLENSVTIFEVVNWLGNFEPGEHELALGILEKLEFFSVARTVSTYNDNLQKIFKHFTTKKNVIFLPIGQFGKSGTAMAYFIKQAPAFGDRRYKKKNIFASSMSEIVDILSREGIDPDDFLLVLVDDFVGSGRSTVEYYNGTKRSKGLKEYLIGNKLNPAISLLSIVILEEGFNYVTSEIGQIFVAAEKRFKIFAGRGSVFGYRPIMLPIREFAYAKGVKLVKEPLNSLGFENSQGLVTFSHTTPNNTLPIIWSPKDNWQPLYPRFGPDKVLGYKKFRDQSYYWLSLAIKHGGKAFFDLKPGTYTTINLQIITIMRLKSMKRSVPVICQIMGITMQEYEVVIQEGVLRGIFNSKGMITKAGQGIFLEIKKVDLMKRNKQKRMLKGNDEIIYLPMTFRGET